MVGAEKLLTADEEVRLGAKVARLVAWEEQRTRLEKLLGREATDLELANFLEMDQLKFMEEIKVCRMAKEKMILSNMRLVISIVRKFMYRGIPINDMIQEGMLGLIRAVEKFDGEKGFKFSTYATWWIKQAVSRSIADNSRVIRLPVHLCDTMVQVKKAIRFLSVSLERPPKEEEVADYCRISMGRLRQLKVYMQSVIWLDAPVNDEQGKTRLSDLLPDQRDLPEERVEQSLLRDDLEHVVNSLCPQERDVVRMRYGLDDGRIKSVEEIGEIFHVSKQRVRQLEKKALRKLRHPFRSNVLRDFLTY